MESGKGRGEDVSFGVELEGFEVCLRKKLEFFRIRKEQVMVKEGC